MTKCKSGASSFASAAVVVCCDSVSFVPSVVASSRACFGLALLCFRVIKFVYAVSRYAPHIQCKVTNNKEAFVIHLRLASDLKRNHFPAYVRAHDKRLCEGAYARARGIHEIQINYKRKQELEEIKWN